MPKLEIQPFSDDDIDAAAGLLAQRHRAHRDAEPLLPDVGDFRPQVEEAWGAGAASGWIASRDGRPVGYMIGAPRDNEVWGPNVWVELGGHAVVEAEIARDLYAVAAEHWVAGGHTSHYVLVPAGDEKLVDAWFRLGFGAQHAMGVRGVPDNPPSSPDPFTVRDGLPGDVAAGLGRALNDHQLLSPVFSQAAVFSDEETEAEWRKELHDERAGNLVAELDGRPVSLVQLAPVEYSGTHVGLARPRGACILGYAATLPEARGTGAGLALTNSAYDWARDHGYETIVVDWRETNLLSSRFWPARGFRRTFQRLYRSIP
jgi:GNAT superfamily N-acetyltransferase